MRLGPAGIVCLLLAASSLSRAAEPDRVQFNRDIRPILSENCFYCHGPDKAHREAEMRLDIREDAVAKKAFLPGQPEKSHLIERINSTDPDELMPPPASHKKLTAKQKETLRRWIAEGAEYEPHWAFIAPKRPAVPAVKQQDWVRTPIDAFILANLEAKKIKPSPEANKAALLRRLSLDLVGLPPSPAEVAAFEKNNDPKAYEKEVDRLLASPHFGERMAVWWLDLARYADTVGYHGDQNVNAWPYREYVVDSFNRNLPFDQFTREQLAGDLLPKPTPTQLVATAFNRLNMVTREGGAQPNEYLAKYGADRVRTVGGTWLGATLGCAECHDHKFDPFTQKDFYSLKAFFADVKQWGVYSDYSYTPNPDLKGFNNEFPFPPEIDVESAGLSQWRTRVLARMNKVFAASATRLAADPKQTAALEVWRQSALDYLKAAPLGWQTPPLGKIEPVAAAPSAVPVVAVAAKADDAKEKPDAKGKGKAKAKDKKADAPAAPTPPALPLDNSQWEPQAADGSYLVKPAVKSGEGLQLVLAPAAGAINALRLELLPHARYGGAIVRSGNSANVALAGSLRPAGGGKETPLAFFMAEANYKQPRYASGFIVQGLGNGWQTAPDKKQSPHLAIYLLNQPLTVKAGDTLTITLRGDVGCVRLSTSPLGGWDPFSPELTPELVEALKAESPRSPAAAATLAGAYLLATQWDAAALAEWRTLYRELIECRGGHTPCIVTQAWEPKPVRVLPRGNWQDESGALVTPAVPHFLPQPEGAEKRRLTRLDLANWLTSAENPLTARVFVNRLWKQFYGAGLSGVLEDVGAQGEWPVHPALLDWFAVEFRESGWNVKHVIKLMVLSNTYRQDARTRPELRELDPQNRWLAAQSPRRLDAEFVRDNALAIAGLINLDFGGPSVRPYQPADYYENLQFPDRKYTAQLDERQYRRGLYMHWQRTFLHPMLANFDAPPRDESICTRTVANTPQQALTLLNDPSFVEAARVLAQQALTADAKTDADRIAWLYQRALSRPPSAKERDSLASFLATQRTDYAKAPDDVKKLLAIGIAPGDPKLDATELAAWTSLCRVVLNLHETVTRY